LDHVFVGGLVSSLGALVPDYMVPSSFVGVTHLPLTASGKLDRAALPQDEGEVARAAFVAPGSAGERQVAQVMEELLGLSGISALDDFFS
ncbi:hypothetical protein Q5Y75_28440, partial [Ruegeria sp. 2205SS24-7]|uniref:hypothetical protein n=1 Tax=Ruegeria discodermiae TaxID=3064389 RepID=UPI002741C2EB